MINNKITLTGISSKLPIINTNEVTLLMKDTSSNFETYYKVIIPIEIWNVKIPTNENTYYIIKGKQILSLNKKNIPYLKVIAEHIQKINGISKDVPYTSLPQHLPDTTDDIMPLSALILPSNFSEPVGSKAKAYNYFNKFNKFEKPIQIRATDKLIVGGHEYYFLAKELNIKDVPVCYNTKVGEEKIKYNDLQSNTWFKNEESIMIKVKDILLTEDVHLNDKEFFFKINLLKLRDSQKFDIPVVIKKIPKKKKYSLVVGASRYFAAKILDIKEIPAVITELSHDEFIIEHIPTEISQLKIKKEPTNCEVIISDIKIPTKYANSKIKKEKVDEMIEYYKNNNKFDKEVTLNSKSLMLIDGYKRYVAAKEMKLTTINAILI